MSVDYVTVESITELFNKRISGHEETKRKLAAAVIMHYRTWEYNLENEDEPDFVKRSMGSILLYGPSGSGKTEFVRTIRDGLGVPVEIVDAVALSPAGFKGLTLDDVMEHYYESNPESADTGIIVFDEFDKLCDTAMIGDQNSAWSRSLINEFLKLAEGKIIKGHDTSDLLFVFLGSFGKLLEYKSKKKLNEKAVGFDTSEAVETIPDENLPLTNEDFISYGMNPEFMGRVILICRLNALSRDEMKHLLTASLASPLKFYREIFCMEGIKLTFSPTAINYIVDEAMKMGLGARGMQKVLNPYMLNILYELDGKKNARISITAMDIKYNRIPMLERCAK